MNGSDRLVPLITLAMLLACSSAVFFQPRQVVDSSPGLLNDLIPSKLQQWTESKFGVQQVSLFAVDENGANPMDEVYDDSLLRTYSDATGHQMMVAMAYDHVQREEDRVHRPEICYIAQGFAILSDQAITLGSAPNSTSSPILGRRMLTQNGNRFEAVSYWIRVGDNFTQNAWISREYVIREGLAGRLHDGVLVRVSEIIHGRGEATASFSRQEAFLETLLHSISPSAAQFIARRNPNGSTP